MSETSMPVDISAIVPVGGRFADPVELYSEYRAGLEALGRSYEIIFVLDGPREKFEAGLKRLASGGAIVHGGRPHALVWRGHGAHGRLRAGFRPASSSPSPPTTRSTQRELPKLVSALERV